MHIGVDANCWANRRGYGRFTRELLHAMLAVDRKNTYWFFLDSDTRQRVSDIPEGVQQVVVPTQRAAVEAASADGSRSPRDLWAMSEAVRRHRPILDVFYFPSVYTFYPLRTNSPVVVSIHDTIPENFPNLVFASRKARLLWGLKVRWAIHQAKMILTGTQAARSALIEHFGIPNELVRIVPDAASAVFRPLNGSPDTREILVQHGIDPEKRFVLYVGGISPHKNLATLLEAFALLADAGATAMDCVKLVVVGDYRGDVFLSSYESLQRRIADLGLAQRVIFTGFVPDDVLVHLYNAADIMVLPSFDEGFGLPAVEAMACGTPVVASRAGALPEVVSDAGVFFDPHSPRELQECLEVLMRDDAKRLELGRRGLIRARDFSWERSATAALAALEALANR